MHTPVTSFYDWQERYATEEACAVQIAELRWPEGFRCPHCGHEHGWYTAARRHYECARCYRQTSITAGTLFHGSRVALRKWFWALYWVSTDKGSISALRLSKLIGVQWSTAQGMLRRLRIAMSHRDSLYRLTELLEVDDAYVGANKTGKAGRGGGRTPVLVAIEKTEENKPGYVAIEVLDSLSKSQIIAFAKRRLQPGSVSHTDAFPSLEGLAMQSTHIAKITPPEEADRWLPWVHIVISNLKRFLLGTYHGAVRPSRLQEYVDEFVYRFNPRSWEPQIPNRLLRLCVEHLPVVLRGT
jgi:transposase-like protein